MELELFTYDFMQRALIAGIFVAIIAPMVGSFLVMRRYSMMADTMAHVSLIGVVIGLLSGIAPPFMALIVNLAAAFAIEKIRETFKSFGDAALSLLLSGSLALSVILISSGGGNVATLNSYLFGSITTVNYKDLFLIGSLTIAVCVAVGLWYQQLFLLSFDEELALADGLPVKKLQMLFLMLVAATVSVTISTIGVLLMGALMVIPVMTAMRGARSFKEVLGMGILYSLLAVVTGLVCSFYFDVPTGGMIVMISLTLFLLRLLVPVRF